jgi:hypothetical protein
MNLIKTALFAGVAITLAAPLHAEQPDAALGKKLHDAHCTGCHNTNVYTHKNRQITSLAALSEQLTECTHAAQVTLSDSEQKSIVKYLNERFYKFK